ncbi:hypothetical protein KKF91_10240 [Myxococcota bacterium]|nr:hypothetical protein [Myxococcota bacterium]
MEDELDTWLALDGDRGGACGCNQPTDAHDRVDAHASDAQAIDAQANDAQTNDAQAQWRLIARSTAPEPLNPALLGQYDLSGALFDYANIPGLAEAMRPAGFREWRVSVGRWEAGTLMLPTLSDGRPCPRPIPGSAAPDGWDDETQGEGGTRALIINRLDAPRSVSLTLEGIRRAPRRVVIFDDPGAAPREVAARHAVVEIPARALALLTF